MNSRIESVDILRGLTIVAMSLLIFFTSSFITKVFYLTKVGDTTIHGWLYKTFFTSVISIDKLASLCYALAVVSFYVFVGYILYKKRFFIKV